MFFEDNKTNSTEDNSSNNEILRSHKTRIIPKNSTAFFSSHKGFICDNLDKNNLYTFSNPLVRIEYPGNVKNVDKAIDTLGGLNEIEKCVEGKTKLELKFHPNSHFNKGCVADKEVNVGILVKVREDNTTSENCSYEIINATDVNFRFNRMCDFQYLPLISKDTTENEDSEVEYVYDKIIPNGLPTLEWLKKREISEQPTNLVSSNFAKFDLPQVKFRSNSSKLFMSLMRPGDKIDCSVRKKKEKQMPVPASHFNFLKPGPKVPDQPAAVAMEIIKEKQLQRHLEIVKKLFQERPVLSKSAVIYKTGISNDTAKYVLPCVAYYCQNGPWRVCWIRLGYDPLSDFNSRIYQVLDFRIRSKEGVQLKIRRKRGFLAKLFKDRVNSGSVTERDYIIRPNSIPPARQMFYQYCDILIPEVQDMLSKLPKLPSSTKYDIKNGWLPISFTDQCREIVNKYVLDAVHEELLSDAKDQFSASSQSGESADNIVTLYCSKMLNTLRKGTNRDESEDNEEIIEQIDLIDDLDMEEQIDANEIVNSLPERMPDVSEEEEEESDMEIDLEALQEVNEVLSRSKE
ncbi:general transcription factor IIIC subunit l(2)37Cd [Rhynchophorus ferrugineus]|uniref:general transcription factor IIIC subunit l(2)37Cd n=1 Tax=Rhynchophorus ferrugineus TaxID=354439 RepID=UPI003FCD78AE